MYCVECGKEDKLYENLCSECFTRITNFFKLKKILKITLCSSCFAREKANHWEEAESIEESINKTIIENISKHEGITLPKYSIELTSQDPNIYHSTVSIAATYDDLNVQGEVETEVRLRFHNCGRCSRLLGNYFEAIVQVRGTNRKLDDNELEVAENIVDNSLATETSSEVNVFLTKSEYIHGGVDFYLGSSMIARQISKKIAKELVGKIKESSSLAGRKDGRDQYRVTYNIRVPEYKPGDIVELNNEVYKILKLMPKRVQCLNFRTGQLQRFSVSDLATYTLLGGSELIYEAVVVLETAFEIQILDPDTYKTIELIKPANFEVTGENVMIFKNQDLILLVPNLVN